MKIEERSIEIGLCSLLDENQGKVDWDWTLLASRWKSRKGWLRLDFACFPMKIKGRLIEIGLCLLFDENRGKTDWDQTYIAFRWKSMKGRLRSNSYCFLMKIERRPNKQKFFFFRTLASLIIPLQVFGVSGPGYIRIIHMPQLICSGPDDLWYLVRTFPLGG